MKNETKVAIGFSALVIILTGSVFGYLSRSTWPVNDIDQAGVMNKANRAIVAERIAKQLAAQSFQDKDSGISFKYPQAWVIEQKIANGDKTFLVKDAGGIIVTVSLQANPKMRKTLQEYLSNKLSLKENIDYQGIELMTVAGKEAFKITMMQNSNVPVSYPLVWVKASDKLWLSIGNFGAPADVVNSIITTLNFADNSVVK